MEFVSSSLSFFSKLRVSDEVFIHCLEDDIHRNFVSHLSSALLQAGVKPAIVAVGTLSEKFMPSITSFQIGIVVISKAYYESSLCGENLRRIIECHETHGLLVMPVFYDMDPSDAKLRYNLHVLQAPNQAPYQGVKYSTSNLHVLQAPNQTPYQGVKFSTSGIFLKKDNFKRALTAKTIVTKEKSKNTVLPTFPVSRALNMAANLPTWDGSKHRNDAELVEEIVKSVLAKLDRALPVTKFPVKLETQVENVIGLFKNNLFKHEVCMIGIWGMGGSGKTTLAKAIYNKIPFTFGDKSFIEDIREVCQTDGRRGLDHLEKQLLSDVLTNVKIESGEMEKITIGNSLFGRKLFIVLEDVIEIDQLKHLCGNREWFGVGSVIIITTRHLDLLYQHKVDYVYEMDELDKNDSVELFSWHAFREAKPREDFNELTRSAVDYCGGLPLALEVLGSCLSKRSENEWRSVLSKLEIIPNAQIQNILRVSFDGLYNEKEKDIFLDVCCFFIGKERDYVTEILNGCGLSADIRIKVLIERGLLKIEKNNKLGMHHLLRDMGREIVRQTSTMQPGKRSRLWFPKDVRDVLTKNTGTEAIVGLSLNSELTNSDSFKADADAFKKMKMLRFLQLDHVQLTGDYGCLSKQLRCISWKGFSLEHIPNNFYLEGAIVIDFQHSNLILVWKEPTVLPLLKILNLSHSKYLTETPDFSKLPSLEKLILKHCVNLDKVHQSIGDSHNLLLINLKGCTNLSNLPSETYKSKSLKTLILSGCLKIDIFKEDILHMKSLKTLFSENTAVKQVPISVVSSKSMGYIHVDEEKGLSLTVLHTVILSWISRNFNPLYRIRPFRGTSSTLVSMNVEHNDLVDVAPILRSFLKLSTVLVQCVTEYSIIQQVTAFLKEVQQVGPVTWTRSTQLSNHPFSPYLIQFGGYQEEVFNTLRRRLYDEGLAVKQTRKVFQSSHNYPHWFAYKSEGHSVKFTVPDNFHMDGMILCVEHLSRLGDPTQYLICVLMVNYTKCIIQFFNRQTITSWKDVDWQGAISPHLRSGDKLKIFIIFEKGFEIQKTAVYLVCNGSTDRKSM